MRNYHYASMLYRPPVIASPVSLLRSESDVTTDSCNGWNDITTGSLSVDNLSGDHLGMMRDTEHRDLLQEKLMDAIEKWN